MRDDKKDWVSFSETDCNGKFREAYGYFERSDINVERNDMESVRERISNSSIIKDICHFSSHDFTRIDVFTGGIKYKCRICGLEATQFNCSDEFDLAFFGSFVDNYSYKWKPDEMDVSKIKKIQITFGDYPIRNVSYVRERNMITYKNTINGSRDGGLRHPDGFFDEHSLEISAAQTNHLICALGEIDFSQWETSSLTIKNLRAGSCGFCVHNSLRLLFENGRSFICYNCGSCEGFPRLTSEICTMLEPDSFTVTEEPQKTIKNVSPKKSLMRGFNTPCCGVEVPEYCNFCPECGKEIKNKKDINFFDIEYDIDQTLWICECLNANPFQYKYCIKCGKKVR